MFLSRICRGGGRNDLQLNVIIITLDHQASRHLEPWLLVLPTRTCRRCCDVVQQVSGMESWAVANV